MYNNWINVVRIGRNPIRNVGMTLSGSKSGSSTKQSTSATLNNAIWRH